MAESDKARLEALGKHTHKPILELVIIPQILLPLVIIVALGMSYAGAGYLFANYHNHDVTVVSHNNKEIEFVVSQFGGNIVTKDYDTKTRSLDNGYTVKEAANHHYTREIIACTDSFKNQSPKSPAVVRCPK